MEEELFVTVGNPVMQKYRTQYTTVKDRDLMMASEYEYNHGYSHKYMRGESNLDEPRPMRWMLSDVEVDIEEKAVYHDKIFNEGDLTSSIRITSDATLVEVIFSKNRILMLDDSENANIVTHEYTGKVNGEEYALYVKCI